MEYASIVWNNCTLLQSNRLEQLQLETSRIVRPKKINYMFLRHRPRHLQTPRIKNFYCISSIHIEKSSKHRELLV